MFLICVIIFQISFGTSIAADSNSTDTEVQVMNCREVIKKSYISMKKPLKFENFSTVTFEELNLTVEEFNQLDQKKLEEFYTKLKPLDQMIDQTRKDLLKSIKFINDQVFAFLYEKEVKEMNSRLAELNVCFI